MSDFHGVMPYLVSPIDGDGKVMDEVLGRLVDRLIKAGVHGLSPLGSTGEFAYLNWHQKKRVVEVVIKAAAGRVPVIPGIAATTTEAAQRQAKAFAALGADGIVAVMEAYFPVTDAGVEAYFRGVADATDLPVVLYTNPNFQRSDLSVPVITRLADHPRIVALKDASTNTGRLLSILNKVGDKLSIFAASSHIPVAVMMIGGKGWLAGPACLVPEQSVRLYQLCRDGQWDQAVALQKRLWSINEVFARYSLAACVKAGLESQGFTVGSPLSPDGALAPAARRDVEQVLADLAEPA